MTFDGIKNNLVTQLGELGYRESKEAFDPENMSPNEYGNTFVINMISGEADENSQRINTVLYDNQVWRIQIAYERSEHNDIIVRDKMYRSISTLIKKIDDPDEWEGVTNGATTQKYNNWEVEPFDSYYILSVFIQIQDRYTY